LIGSGIIRSRDDFEPSPFKILIEFRDFVVLFLVILVIILLLFISILW